MLLRFDDFFKIQISRRFEILAKMDWHYKEKCKRWLFKLFSLCRFFDEKFIWQKCLEKRKDSWWKLDKLQKNEGIWHPRMKMATHQGLHFPQHQKARLLHLLPLPPHLPLRALLLPLQERQPSKENVWDYSSKIMLECQLTDSSMSSSPSASSSSSSSPFSTSISGTRKYWRGLGLWF